MGKKIGKQKTHRVNTPVDIDLTEAQAEKEKADPQGLLRNFVLVDGIPKWGKATFATGGKPSDTYDKLSKLQKVDSVTHDEVGLHSVVLVYFEQGQDGKWRFHQVATDEIQVIA